MSRLAKKPIKLPDGVSVKIDNSFLLISGPKGENKIEIPPGVGISVKKDDIFVRSESKGGKNGVVEGTVWSLVKSGTEGVFSGFSKTLDMEGVGYRALIDGDEIVLHLGYSNPVRLKIPGGIKVEVEKNTIKISGISKELVGQVAADIRATKKPEPYKGKGIRYRDEVVRRKAGKKAGAATAAA